MKKIIVYTDGACSGNPGPGGWGAVLLYGEKRLELSGYEARTTNNRMEITAAIRALAAIKEPCEVDLHSDSTYLVDAHRKNWLANWQRNHWLKSNKQPVENVDLWEALLSAAAPHKITWIKVKGHASNVENNRCDALATGEIQKHRAAGKLS